MKPGFECSVAASFLGSGRILCQAGNFAAVIAAAGIFLTHAAAARLLFAASILCWPFTLYLGVRVAIDARLFRELAGDPVGGGPDLDELLHAWGLLRVRKERTPSERSRGALRLWIRLVTGVAVQLAALAAAIVVEVLKTS